MTGCSELSVSINAQECLSAQILRRIPREVYSGAVHTALKRSADMSVEEAIQYKVRAQRKANAVTGHVIWVHALPCLQDILWLER